MSLKIKIPKQSAQVFESSRPARPAKRRLGPDAEVDDCSKEPDDEPAVRPRFKRARTHESSNDADAYGLDDEGESEADVKVEIEEVTTRKGCLPQGTRSSPSESPPPGGKPPKRSGSTKAKHTAERRVSSSTVKTKRKTRQVVWTDDEEDEADPLGLTAADPDDDDFKPEPSTLKRGTSRTKVSRSLVAKKGGRSNTKVEEKEITMRDERKLPPPEPPISSEETTLPAAGDTATAATDTPEDDIAKVEDAVPPPAKKRKLPPIKKNKPTNAPSASAAPKPAAVAGKTEAAASAKDSNTPVGVAARKPAATMGATDFDLRDASVYASLFNKPGRQMPDSGLNRRQREEERRKELNKMREEARAKRTEEAKHTFDLQAANDKIIRFEEKLRARNSYALYPNVLGAYWKQPSK